MVKYNTFAKRNKQIIWNIALLISFTLILYENEHIIDREGYTMVACVKSVLTSTDVFYYEYRNGFIMGRLLIHEHHKGNFDPIKKYNDDPSIGFLEPRSTYYYYDR